MKLLVDYWPIAAFVFNLVFGGLLWAAKRQFATKEELSVVDTRLGKAEASIAQMPTREDIAKIKLDLAGIAGDVKETNAEVRALRQEKEAELRGINRLLERVENAVTRHETIFADAARGHK